MALDPQGTMVELHPYGTALFPGEVMHEAAHLQLHPGATPYSANHTAISVPINMAQIRAIADREQWRMVLCRRGNNYFDIIQLWLENQLLIELLPPELVDRYLAFMDSQALLATAQAL